jgi:acyl-CoA synthetase (NDP forming)
VLGTGGQGVVSTDACQRLGLEVPELDKVTSSALKKMLPPHAPLPTNPVDFAGSYRTAMDEADVVETLLKLDYIDGVISNVPINPLVWGLKLDKISPAVLENIQRLTNEGTKRFCDMPRIYGKPIICVRWYSDAKKDPVSDTLKQSGIPVYDTPEQCARAMDALAKYSTLLRRKQIC